MDPSGPSGGCTISVDSFEQPAGTSILPTQVDRTMDLIIKGTATPDGSGVTGTLTIDGTVHNLTTTSSAGDWTCTVSKSLYQNSAAAGATIRFKKACATPPDPETMNPIGFKN